MAVSPGNARITGMTGLAYSHGASGWMKTGRSAACIASQIGNSETSPGYIPPMFEPKRR
jgi:hypothetical protein